MSTAAPSQAPGPGSNTPGQGPSADVKHTSRATIIGAVAAAVITGSLGVLTGYLGRGDTDPTPETTATVTVTAEPPFGPLALTIEEDGADLRTVMSSDNYEGTVQNIQPGQVVWMFSQILADANGTTVPFSSIHATSGPCEVNEAESTWSCEQVGIGVPGAEGAGRYKVWASVVDERQAFEIVEALRHNEGDITERQAPPNLGAEAVVDITVLRATT